MAMPIEIAINSNWMSERDFLSPLVTVLLKDVLFLTGQVSAPIASLEKVSRVDPDSSDRRAKSSQKKCFKFLGSFSMLVSVTECFLRSLDKIFTVDAVSVIIGASVASPKALYTLQIESSGISPNFVSDEVSFERRKQLATRQFTRQLIQAPWVTNHPVANTYLTFKISCNCSYPDALDALKLLTDIDPSFDLVYGIRERMPKLSSRRRLIKNNFIMRPIPQIPSYAKILAEDEVIVASDSNLESASSISSSIISTIQMSVTDLAVDSESQSMMLSASLTTFWVVLKRGLKPFRV